MDLNAPKKTELVSVITPTFNSAKFVSETIQSVISQDYNNWEMIVIDDHSSDNTVEIVHSWIEKDKRIRLLTNSENLGPAITRNRGIENAKGRYIAFLDSDDLWQPQKLSQQISFMNENQVALCYTSYKIIDEQNNFLGDFYPPSTVDYDHLLKTCSIGCLTVIYDTKKTGKEYMPLIKKRQDYGLWLKILRKKHKAMGMQALLAVYRKRVHSISSNKFKAAFYQWKIYRKFEKLNIFKSIFYFIFYAYYGTLKSSLATSNSPKKHDTKKPHSHN